MARGESINLLQFQSRFATDEACHDHLFNTRWPDGFCCPRCGSNRSYWLAKRQLYQCVGCRYQVSVTAGTVFHRSRVPLRKWFWALFLAVHDKRGVSALMVSRALSIRYETAWFMLHKIRQAMQTRDQQYQLQGLVEMDDGYFGGIAHGQDGRGVRSTCVIVAVGVKKRRPTFAKMAVVQRMTKEEISHFAEQACQQGALVRTDGLNAYRVLDRIGFEHLEVITKRHPDGAGALPYVHTVISNAKTWLLGTFHGGVRPKYMSRYLNEFCYRFNRRTFSGQEFSRLLRISTEFGPTTYAELTG